MKTTILKICSGVFAVAGLLGSTAVMINDSIGLGIVCMVTVLIQALILFSFAELAVRIRKSTENKQVSGEEIKTPVPEKAEEPVAEKAEEAQSVSVPEKTIADEKIPDNTQAVTPVEELTDFIRRLDMIGRSARHHQKDL